MNQEEGDNHKACSALEVMNLGVSAGETCVLSSR